MNRNPLIPRVNPSITLFIGLIGMIHGPQLRAQEAGVKLAQNAQPQAVIVLPDAAGRSVDDQSVRMENQAGNILVDFVNRMSGAKLNIVHVADLGEVQVDGDHLQSAKVPAASYVVVGVSDLTRKLKFPAAATEAGATYVRAAGNTVVLMGAEDGTAYQGGAVYSTYSFLESLGCRYLWPGKSGLVLPQKSTLVAPYGTTSLVPTIKQRYMRMSLGYDRARKGAEMLGIGQDEWLKGQTDAAVVDSAFVERGMGGWEQWQRLGGDISINGGHAFGAIYDQQAKDHPGWFALQPDGTRVQKNPERAVLCTSNSELIAYIADGFIARIKTDPTLRSISISPNDGGPDAFCMCKVNALGEPGCVTYDPPQGRKIENFRGWNRDYVSLTDRYVDFWNKIAARVTKVYPKMLFVVDAYSYYEAPPVERKLDPSLVVRYIQYSLTDWDEWSSKASMMTWRPNILHNSWQVGYLQFNRQWAKDLNYTAHHKVIATDFDSILNSWATEGLNYYVLARLNYNPDLNVNDLVEDYCRSGFGPAHHEIRQYFDKVAALTDLQQVDELALFKQKSFLVHQRVDAFSKVYGPGEIAELRGYLDAATRAAAQDTAVLRRVEFLRVGLEWTAMQSRAYKVLLAWKRKEPVDLIAAGKLLDDRRVMMRDIFRKNPLAVNISYAYYGDRAYWQGLEDEIAKAVPVKTPANSPATGKIGGEADENGQPIP